MRSFQPFRAAPPVRGGESPKPRPRTWLRGRGVGIYVLLLALPLVVLLPLLAYSGSLLYLVGQKAHEATERELQASSRALALVVQREIERTAQTLDLVASTPALVEGRLNLPRLRQLMLDVTQANNGIDSLAVVEPDGRVVLRYPARPGDAARLRLTAPERRAFETGQVQISELRQSELDARLAISISQPVRRNGGVPWIISARFDPAQLNKVLSAQVGERQVVALVLDPLHRIIAGNRDYAPFVGERPPPEVIRALSASEVAGVRRLSLPGQSEHLWASSSTSAGWSVLLGIPANEVDAAFSRSVLQLGAAGLAALLLGVAVTVLLARRIALSVHRMAENAPLLARGEHAPYRRSGIRQLDALYAALLSASRQTQEAIADRDRALAAERVARQMADADNRAKDVFIATLSHELRNPLAPVRSAAHILRAPNASDAARERAAQVIERQVGAMARLLDDLLDLSRIRSGRVELNRQPVSLQAVLDSAIEAAQPLIDVRRHTLVCQVPPEDPVLEADPLRLSQVFTNLLTNAAKYTDPGGRIDLRVETLAEAVVVRVRDTGVGLKPEEFEQVFQMFSQVRGSHDRTQGGLGIGLWLVRALVELHGGWARVESEGPGRGSEFVVGLPRDMPPASAGAEAGPPG
ncbi:sensor histidine kinase [Ramlibacter sp. AW1]|uniref:histidine kinase n=1 Tax=Ramlibacter aurantiacus TaxID=2801330 RepID=A0A936ZEJ1_9BURK|nr:ATP-binding protein [Ramlibacter aurantiacus]MBL0418828.1 sensor histidine kinase [Ramlibacter aurantiacus]